jgi:proline iminopeptidase
MFDPNRYRIVQFDQRNCGSSTPHAGEPRVDLSTNTTQHLIGDCERLRDHLAIERWLVSGGSWGSTLALAYAQEHPGSVSEMVLWSVVDPSRHQIELVTRGMACVFPDEHAAFLELVPDVREEGSIPAAYSRLLHDPDPAIHDAAAEAWCRWEDTHVATTPGYRHDDRYDDPRFRLCFARLVTHYWSNDCFLEDGQLLARAHRLAGMPGVMMNGMLDVSGPPDFARALADRWPESELVLLEGAGHGIAAPRVREAMRVTTDRLAVS